MAETAPGYEFPGEEPSVHPGPNQPDNHGEGGGLFTES